MSSASGQCITVTSGSLTTTDITLDPGSTIQNIWTRSTAFSLSYARQVVPLGCCDPEFAPCTREDYDYMAMDSGTVVGATSSAAAASVVSLSPPATWWIDAAAECSAATSGISPSGPEIVVDHDCHILVSLCFECEVDYRAHNAGRASAVYEIELASGGSFFYCFNPRVGGSSIFVGTDGLMRIGAYFARAGVSPMVRGITVARDSVESSGLTFDSMTGDWVDSENVAGIDGTPAFVGTFRFTDASLDVDGDGRFSALDADALELRVGADDELDMNWDFDSSGTITEMDVEILRAIAAAGLESGLLGDYDGDGDADCSDLYALHSIANCEFGDAAYRPAVDADLDGDLDDADRSVVCREVQPADRNCDGVVDFSDYLQFLDEYSNSDPAVDFNGDSSVDFADYLIFMDAYDAGCA